MGCSRAGSLCGSKSGSEPDKGTNALTKHQPPGSVTDDVVRFVLEKSTDWSEHVPGTVKWLVLSALQVAGVKKESPNTLRLFKHYLDGSGKEYRLDPVPPNWQDLIVKHHGAKVGKVNVNPYNWGAFDLQNSLGHFDLTVQKDADGKHKYLIDDFYDFPFTDDKGKVIRHGFEVDKETAGRLRKILPAKKYARNQRFEIATVGHKLYLYLPTEWLRLNGKPFKVHGEFKR